MQLLPQARIYFLFLGVLLQSCSDLVNPDGTLTAAGVTAKACIANGVGLALEGLGLGLPYNTVISGNAQV